MTKEKLIKSPSIKPLELEYDISETVVRMTLNELCGSVWDNYPFDGEVEQNSFFFERNNMGSRGRLTKTYIYGTFFEQNGKTKITLFSKTGIINWVLISLFAILSLLSIAVSVADVFVKGSLAPITAVSGGVGISLGFAALIYIVILIKSRRYFNIIKNTLDNVPLR